MKAKRQRANQARETLGKQVVPWNFGTPSTASDSGHVQVQPLVRHTGCNKPRKRHQSARPMGGSTVKRLQSNHRPRNTDLTWDEFLHGYALPFSSQRIDPLISNVPSGGPWGTSRHILDRMRCFQKCAATSWSSSADTNKQHGGHMGYTQS